jgi:hypothetical protein
MRFFGQDTKHRSGTLRHAPEDVLGNSILQGMKRDYAQSPAGVQDINASAESGFERIKFSIHRNPEPLECPRGEVNAPMTIGRRHRPTND